MEACGRGRHEWLGVMDGNMYGDAAEKGGAEEKAE